MIPLPIADENIQFPVLRKYEQHMLFDLCSFVVPIRTMSFDLAINKADCHRFSVHFEQRLAVEKSKRTNSTNQEFDLYQSRLFE